MFNQIMLQLISFGFVRGQLMRDSLNE